MTTRVLVCELHDPPCQWNADTGEAADDLPAEEVEVVDTFRDPHKPPAGSTP